MSKMNYNRKQSTSFVPLFTALSESECQEKIFDRVGKAKFYKNMVGVLKEEKLAHRADYWERRVRLQKEAEVATAKAEMKSHRLELIAQKAKEVAL